MDIPKQIPQPNIPDNKISYDSLLKQGYANPLLHPGLDQATIPEELRDQYSTSVAPTPELVADVNSSAPTKAVIADAGRLATFYIDSTSGVVMTPTEAAKHDSLGSGSKH